MGGKIKLARRQALRGRPRLAGEGKYTALVVADAASLVSAEAVMALAAAVAGANATVDVAAPLSQPPLSSLEVRIAMRPGLVFRCRLPAKSWTRHCLNVAIS